MLWRRRARRAAVARSTFASTLPNSRSKTWRGVGQGGQRRRGRTPANAAGVGATVLGVAQTDHAGVFQAQFERGKSRLAAAGPGRELVRRHPREEVRSRLARVRPRQE